MDILLDLRQDPILQAMFGEKHLLAAAAAAAAVAAAAAAAAAAAIITAATTAAALAFFKGAEKNHDCSGCITSVA